MHRKVNNVIIQQCSTTRLVNVPHNAYSKGVGHVKLLLTHVYFAEQTFLQIL